MATSRPRLFSRLPKIWQRLDGDPNDLDYVGVLERFLGVVDNDFDRIHAKTKEFFDLRTVDRIPDRFLPLLATLVGHVWDNDKSYAWNRRRVRNSIDRHSYKGTFARMEDTAKEFGAEGITVTDMASKLCVLGKQGRLSYPDCYLVAPDYYHDGAFKASIVDRTDPRIDLNALIEELASTIAAGERWYWEVTWPRSAEFGLNVEFIPGQLFMYGDTQIGSLGMGLFGGPLDENAVFLAPEPSLWRISKLTMFPVYWYGFNYDGDYEENYLYTHFMWISHYPWTDLFDLDTSKFTTQLTSKSSYFNAEAPTYFTTLTCSKGGGFEIALSRHGSMTSDLDNFDDSTEFVGDLLTVMHKTRSGIAGAYLTEDSNLPANITSILANQGNETYPLTELQAAQQCHAFKYDDDLPS
jgi:hypothetical protein